MFQDRLTFRRIIVKNNAKKRKMYESFIETLPLLTSLEVRGFFSPSDVSKAAEKHLHQSDLLQSTALREDEGGGCDILKGVQ